LPLTLISEMTSVCAHDKLAVTNNPAVRSQKQLSTHRPTLGQSR
jgi:hypothetical protein